jgi:hypothetical protein
MKNSFAIFIFLFMYYVNGYIRKDIYPCLFFS